MQASSDCARTRAASTNVGSFEQREGLLRGVGDGSRGGAFLARGCVEVGQHRMQEGPLPVHVNAPSVLAMVGVGNVVAIGKLKVGVVTGRLVGEDARPADVQVDQPRDGQRVVANEFGIEPARRLRGEEPVVGVDIVEFGAEARVLAIRRRHDQQLDHPLDVPTAVPEFEGQPVEQLGMEPAIRPGGPTSSTWLLIPVPKNCFQSRFMNTRAVSGLSGAVSQRARSSRVSRPSFARRDGAGNGAPPVRRRGRSGLASCPAAGRASAVAAWLS